MGQKKKNPDQVLKRIKEEGENNKYDCVVGVSGGLDSLYNLYMVKKLGFELLAVHLDNGWNTKLAENNISKLVKKLNVDLYKYATDLGRI
ncbi:MAG: 7-cyano-7-deazaguanine synthase [Candidatus Marinimicrobia bacterium]|nr:7-cyano-7-deazaguanine synthase [Candidatus Neomarinimicrobiota bacterium]